LIQLEDVGMVDLFEDVHLALYSQQIFLIHYFVLLQNLYGCVLVCRNVFCLFDLTEGSLSYCFL